MAKDSRITTDNGRRFKNTPLPRPAALTAYAADGGWSTRTRINCAAALICGYAAPRLEGEEFPPFAYPSYDFSMDLNRAITGQFLESECDFVAEARRARLARIVGALKEEQGFVPFFARAAKSLAVRQYAEAVCDALRVKPTAHWLANPSAVCRVAISTLYLSAGKLSAAEE